MNAPAVSLQDAAPGLAEPGHGSWYYAVQVTAVGGRKALVGLHMRALHMHAYGMLGSLDDADEALQDALLSA